MRILLLADVDERKGCILKSLGSNVLEYDEDIDLFYLVQMWTAYFRKNETLTYGVCVNETYSHKNYRFIQL